MSMEKRENSSRQPVGFPQLCLIVREQLLADPTIDDSEWKARVKDRLINLRFTYPQQLDAIERAMRAVEVALTRQGTPRPPPQIQKSVIVATTPTHNDPPWRWPRKIGAGLVSLSEI